MPSHIAYIGPGSNLGNRESNLKKAILLLESCKEIKITKSSNVYETSAVRGKESSDDPNYLNAAIEIHTELKAPELLKLLLQTESNMGRALHRSKNEPRVIDLDLLLYDNTVIEEPGISVPHPLITERLFVLCPLCDINEEIKHPKLNKSILEMKNALLKTDCKARIIKVCNWRLM